MEPREKAAALPESPGVYLFKDAGGKVLYVGKARSLRNRVRSYFLESRWADAKTGSLAREIADLETIVVGNERGPAIERLDDEVPISDTSSSTTRRKRWRSKTTSSRNISRNSTSFFATTKRIRTSSSRPRKNIRGSTSRGASRKTDRSILGRIFRRALRGESCTSYTSDFWFLPARWT